MSEEGIVFSDFLQDYLEGSQDMPEDLTDPEAWENAQTFVANIARLIEEGVLEVERDANGAVRLYPGH